MANKIIADLVGTLRAFFRIGSVRLKNSAGDINVRNAADTAWKAAIAEKVGGRNVTDFGFNLKAAVGSVAVVEYTMPAADAVATSNDYALVSNGTGGLTWVLVVTGANTLKKQSSTVLFSSSSPVAIFTPPALATIQTIVVDVDTAFDGAPTLAVGIGGDTGKYMSTTENELGTVGVYETSPEFQEDGSPDAIIATFVAGGATAGSCEVVVVYANPA